MFTATKHSGVKNGRFRALGRLCPIKNRAAKDEDLHTRPTFVHVFRSNFATFRVFVSTPNFQKSTPNFQKALTFFLSEAPFLPKSNQPTENQRFANHQKKQAFFRPKVFSWRIFKIWRSKMAILSILFKKRTVQIGVTRWGSIGPIPAPLLGWGQGAAKYTFGACKNVKIIAHFFCF